MITEDPPIKKPLPSTENKPSSEEISPEVWDKIIPIKIPTQNPEHLMQVRSLDKRG